MILLALTASALMFVADVRNSHPVHNAREAKEIAAKNSPPRTEDADPKNWSATFNRKTKMWDACAGRPRSLPQSGFCITIDAKTGQVMSQEVIN